MLRSVVDLHCGVVPAPDQVEQRRGELERAGLAALAEQGRHERRLGVGGRLLLVLAVVSCLGLAAEPPEDRHRDQEGRDRPDREDDQRGPPRVRLGLVDLLLSRSYAWASSSSSAVIFASPLPFATFIPPVDVNASRG